MQALPSWKNVEEHVKGISKVIWGINFSSKNVGGRQIDCYAEIGRKKAVAVEITEQKKIEKLQEDINKLTHVRNVNFQKGMLTECILVVNYEPTDAMRRVADEINIDLYTVSEFSVKYLPFNEYVAQRKALPFGSAINPETGQRDERKYVKVNFELETGGLRNIDWVSNNISSNRPIVLTGEYGTGKSKSFERLFEILINEAWTNKAFPLAIDLRKCWGLRDRYEILRRHLSDVNMSDKTLEFERAYNNGEIVLLIDGFDEVGTQAWSQDPTTLKLLRSEALTGVRDLLQNHRGGKVICGRAHYFDSNEELLSALGIASQNPIFVETKTEFSYQEIKEFLDLNDINIDVPEWLPRKPFTCEFYAKLIGSFADPDVIIDALQFWDLYLDGVCARESRTHASFSIESIRAILISVAAVTRSKPSNVGPLSISEIQKAFEHAIGQSPVEQASVLLQRLPGLGRIESASDDRQFVDTYLLDGLRALNVVDIVNKHDLDYKDHNWINPLKDTGLLICAYKLSALNLLQDATSFVIQNHSIQNRTLLSDIITCLLLSGLSEVDFSGLQIDGGHFGHLSFDNILVKNLHVSDSVIERISLSGVPPQDVAIINCVINMVEGVTDETGLPNWIKKNDISHYSSLATVSRIKSANLKPCHKVLVTILRKTFFQRGTARKEEALLRGLGRIVKTGDLDRIINRTIAAGLLVKDKGESGSIYIPVRSETRRVGQILAELNLSKDPLWVAIGEI